MPIFCLHVNTTIDACERIFPIPDTPTNTATYKLNAH